MALTKQEVIRWRDDPVTKEFINGLNVSRNDIFEHLASGGCLRDTTDGTAQELAGELGKLKAIDDTLRYTVEDLIDDSADEESEEC